MKTAEEWRKSRYFGNNSDDGIDTIIKEIQLDAMKEGMKRAAVIAKQRLYEEGFINEGKIAEDAILTAAENLTLEDLK